jgi:hypothetical protein
VKLRNVRGAAHDAVGGRGSLLTPIAAPIAYLPIKLVPGPTLGRISPNDANYALYRQHLRRTTSRLPCFYRANRHFRFGACYFCESAYISRIRITALPC